MNVNNNSFPGPLIIGTFERQAPGHLFNFGPVRVGAYYFPNIFSKRRYFLENNKTRDNKLILLQQDKRKCKN